MERDMQKAVAEENYELAACLRDEINNRQKEEEKKQ
jgi:protein-arginine kinase activator protein McsA